MKRTKEDMFAKRVEYVLNLVLNNGGKRIDVAKLHYRGAAAKRLFDTVKSSLQMMGIEIRTVPDTMMIRVPTQKQLKAEHVMFDDMITGIAYTNKRIAIQHNAARQSGKSTLHSLLMNSAKK